MTLTPIKKKMDEDKERELKILCPFCNAPYTAEMEEHLRWASEATSPSGYGAGAGITITITCSNCKRVVYKKDTEVE